ncbi:MAG: 3-phosphoserine/phosphohydroxythreonine transaminase, partial [Candidatus Hydrogenedentes bacterium CG07_land_8_20_14_0_80_42_17]
MTQRPYNLYAGPAILPLEVIQQAQAELLDFAGTGLSILEISHRSKEFDKTIKEAEADLRTLFG